MEPLNLKNVERKIQENKLILEFVAWLKETRPLPPGYDYMFTVHGRLNPTPAVAIYLVEDKGPGTSFKSEDALGGLHIELPSQWDVVDGIKFLWNQVKHRDIDIRDFIPKEPLQ